MATVTYTFGDVYTGAVITELPLGGVSVNQSLDGGDFRGALNLDRTGFDNDIVLSATIPGRCYVVVERDGGIVGDFIIRSRTYQSQAKSLQLYGSAWKDYPSYRLTTNSYSATKEQRNIFVDLYIAMQSAQNSVIVDLPSADSYATQVTKTLEFGSAEYKSYRQAMDSIADSSDGFDWLINTNRVGGIYTRTLSIGYPTIGSPINHGAVTFEYPGNIFNYWATDGMGDSGTHFYGLGAGEGTNMLVSTVVHSDLISSGFPRYDVDLSYKDITNQSVLDGRTAAQAAVNKAPTSVIVAEILGTEEPVFGGYGLGDACRVVIRDARYPDTLIKTTRIYGWEYYPADSENVEYVRVTLEGD